MCKNVIQSLINIQANQDMVWITQKIRAFVIWFGLWITLNLLEFKFKSKSRDFYGDNI